MKLTITNIPKGIKIYRQIETTKHNFIVFGVSNSAVYDLSFGKQQFEAKRYLTHSQVHICAYDKDANWLAKVNAYNYRDMFEYNGTVVIIGGDNIFYYFDTKTNTFVEKKYSYPFSIGEGSTYLNGVSEDVAIISHNYYAYIRDSDYVKVFNSFVNAYNTLNLKKKLRPMTLTRIKAYMQFTVNIMINKNFEVESVERYWHVPVNEYGYKKLFAENPKLTIHQALVS